MLKEIRIHGRGGQGSVLTAELLAHAAFKEGKWVQAFPFFGAERRGAPIKAFVRIADEPILIRHHVYTPDYVMILDPTLVDEVNVVEELKEDGIIIVNTTKKPKELDIEGYCMAIVDATEIALKLQLFAAGIPIVNTAMLGAFAKATGEVSIESIINVIEETWSGSVAEKNMQAAKQAYNQLQKER